MPVRAVFIDPPADSPLLSANMAVLNPAPPARLEAVPAATLEPPQQVSVPALGNRFVIVPDGTGGSSGLDRRVEGRS